MVRMADGPVVEYRPDDDHATVVRLSLPYPTGPDGIGMLTVEIEAEGISCRQGVLTLQGDGLDRFLTSLAEDWRGWDGTRTWDALEHGMTIEASHRGRRVELLFIVRRDFKPDAWELRLPVLVEPGESLARVAKETSNLLAFGRHT
jgi:hypothetical protein